jgi:hypothetical protein
VTCDRCGDVNAADPALREAPAGEWRFTFTCPRCERAQVKELPGMMLDQLRAANVRRVPWSPSTELADIGRTSVQPLDGSWRAEDPRLDAAIEALLNQKGR